MPPLLTVSAPPPCLQWCTGVSLFTDATTSAVAAAFNYGVETGATTSVDTSAFTHNADTAATTGANTPSALQYRDNDQGSEGCGE